MEIEEDQWEFPCMHIREWLVMVTLNMSCLAVNVIMIAYVGLTWMGVLALLFLLAHLGCVIALLWLQLRWRQAWGWMRRWRAED